MYSLVELVAKAAVDAFLTLSAQEAVPNNELVIAPGLPLESWEDDH